MDAETQESHLLTTKTVNKYVFGIIREALQLAFSTSTVVFIIQLSNVRKVNNPEHFDTIYDFCIPSIGQGN